MNLILNFKTGKTTTLTNVKSIKFRENIEKTSIEANDLLNCTTEPLFINCENNKTILIFENSLESIEVQN